jgi:hypothetical protein
MTEPLKVRTDMKAGGSSENHSEAAGLKARTQASMDFQIQNYLGLPHSISERTGVIVAGKRVGTLTVDAFDPDATLTVTVPAGPERYDYTLSSVTQFGDRSDSWEMTGSGQGTIYVSEGKTFHVEGTDGPNETILLSLVQTPYQND